MDKRIITHTVGEYTYSNGFIFGNYGWSLTKYKQLADEAKRDFPHLTDEDIEVRQVRESGYMKEFAYVRFPLPANTTKEGYSQHAKPDFY